MKTYCLSLLISLMTVAAIAPPAYALTVCQDTCNSQYYNTVNTLWQTPRPTTTAPTTYRQQVMAALNTLNQCMAACTTSTSPTEPTPTPAPAPTPTPAKGKK
ncbi:MAG: hypothetical protein FIB02_07130 [Desulfuromonas sp.]|nr:hypothetical protein [Desulfuromonas sp.]